MAQSQQWSGPLPPPAALEHFNQIIPHGAERIMAMVEREQEHRIEYEKKQVDGEISGNKRSHIIGGSITISAIFMAVIGAYFGVHPAVCIAVVGLPIASIIKSIFGK